MKIRELSISTSSYNTLIILILLTFERIDVRRFGQRQHHVHPKQQVRVQHVHGGAVRRSRPERFSAIRGDRNGEKRKIPFVRKTIGGAESVSFYSSIITTIILYYSPQCVGNSIMIEVCSAVTKLSK